MPNGLPEGIRENLKFFVIFERQGKENNKNPIDDKSPPDQGPAEPLRLTVHGITAKKVLMTQYRIDQDHSNSYQVWRKMGSPQHPTPQQIAELEKAGQLEVIGSPAKLDVNAGALSASLSLPRQGVALIELAWPRGE